MVRALLPAVLLAACDAGFADPTIVVDLRVLSITAEPAEVVADFDPANPEDVELPPVELEVLVADPEFERRLEFIMTACPPTDTLRCDDPEAPFINIGSGSIDDPDGPAAVMPRGTLQMNPVVLREALRADDLAGFGGIGVQIEIVIFPAGEGLERAIYASKKVVYAPRIPEDRVANANPRFTALLLDETAVELPRGRCADGGTPLVVAPGDEVILEPEEANAIRETYVLPTFDGGTRQITENIRYSWFASAGSFSSGSTGGPTDFFGNVPPLDTTWRAPREGVTGPVRLWLVQRDERGGAYWEERCIVVSDET
jgi:hypothetical protein